MMYRSKSALSARIDTHQSGQEASLKSYTTPNPLLHAGFTFLWVPPLLLLTAIIMIRGVTLIESGPTTLSRSIALGGILLLLTFPLLILTVVLLRRGILLLMQPRLLIVVHDEGLSLTEGRLWQQKSTKMIRWNEIKHVQQQKEQRFRMYSPLHRRRNVPIFDQIMHCTLELRDGTRFALREDVQGIEVLISEIEAAMNAYRSPS